MHLRRLTGDVDGDVAFLGQWADQVGGDVSDVGEIES